MLVTVFPEEKHSTLMNLQCLRRFEVRKHQWESFESYIFDLSCVSRSNELQQKEKQEDRRQLHQKTVSSKLMTKGINNQLL
jgi:hypothetical protein